MRDRPASSDPTTKPGSQAAPTAPDLSAERLPAGAALGRYAVLHVLGEGGMGVVYAAYDPELDRKVAIKLLKVAAETGSASTDGQTRLLREAQAMARLSHPNVLPVYDVGPYGDGVFVAIEFVDGRTLEQWAEERPRTWRETLEVFLAAGQGLSAAHRVGLIHRDFKPANVLLGKDGRVRVTDFGLARSVDAPPAASLPVEGTVPRSRSALSSSLTLAGAVMGTPDYMAPEQHAGAQTTAATDQFAFCASLYRILYGAPPFVGKTLREMAEATRAGAVTPAPAGTQVPPWIRRILLKGLSPAPAARFASMDTLLSTLSRDPAVLRRRWAAGVGVALLALAAVGATRLYVRRQTGLCQGQEQRLDGVWDGKVKAQGARAFADTGLSYAAESWDRASAAMDAYAQSWAAMRTQACEATRLRGDQSESQMELRMSCLDGQLSAFKATAAQLLQSDPKVVENAVRSTSALPPLTDCADLRALADPHRQVPPQLRVPVEEARRELAEAHALFEVGKMDAAGAQARHALALAARLSFRPLDAEVHELLARVETDAGHPEKAQAEWLATLENAIAVGDGLRVARALIGAARAVLYRQPAEARVYITLAQAELDHLGGDARVQAMLLMATADLEWRTGKNKEKEFAAYTRARLLFEQALGPINRESAEARASVGWMLMEVGRYDEARREINGAKDTWEKLLGAGHPTVGKAWNYLGALDLAEGRWEEAIHDHRKTQALFTAVDGAVSPRLFPSLLSVATAYRFAGRLDEGLSAIRHAKELETALATPDPARVSAALCEEGRLLRALHRVREAAALHRRALAMLDVPTTGPAYLAEPLAELGEDLITLGQPTAGVPLLRRALQLLETQPDPSDIPSVVAPLAPALWRLGFTAEAKADLIRALAVPQVTADTRWEGARCRMTFAELTWSEGHPAEALASAASARSAFANLKATEDLARADAWIAAHPAPR